MLEIKDKKDVNLPRDTKLTGKTWYLLPSGNVWAFPVIWNYGEKIFDKEDLAFAVFFDFFIYFGNGMKDMPQGARDILIREISK